MQLSTSPLTLWYVSSVFKSCADQRSVKRDLPYGQKGPNTADFQALAVDTSILSGVRGVPKKKYMRDMSHGAAGTARGDGGNRSRSGSTPPGPPKLLEKPPPNSPPILPAPRPPCPSTCPRGEVRSASSSSTDTTTESASAAPMAPSNSQRKSQFPSTFSYILYAK